MAPRAKKPKRTNKPSPLERMKEAFELVNLDTDSLISRSEFQRAMEAIGIEHEHSEQVFRRFDPDNSGFLDKEEFFAFAAKGAGEVKALFKPGEFDDDEDVERIVETFKKWDKDGDGFISKEELERVLIILNPSFTKKELNMIFKEADKNKDGKIDYEEFTRWLKEAPKKKKR
mmetsp:Transcript_72817/g.152052  ORF Transcript_72817/g.152052 Transcript_72817/m.152052 type:complete len:173 (-) Transcript_72817:258-776(-)|eukprot:CAMPEP_0206480370 /NCGR_PEP_ID=MMETSP0324_2-20121206/37263_1 /ASSEMBLY_ACC=CAM_ASM_000836 /TAXON_ID=2866 /ORGANISM="Crypthecodinium cohnii, Strain Seligo" /LENGTH=172 /DNA_ID=CAMNT_0053957163 /DNA_START=290 /DNA_END=808 /DNA_ORIENTATION=+